MKLSIIIYTLLFFFTFSSDKNKRKYQDENFAYEFHIAEKDKKVKLKKGVNYHYYDYNSVKSSDYGFNGRLLHGSYVKAILASNRIIEKGSFVYGVKQEEWKKWFKNGNLKTIQFWKNGRKEGIYELYDESSKLLLVAGNYYKGKKQWEWIQYIGDKKIVQNWFSGVLYGEYKEYKLGKLVKRGAYKKGLKHGIWADKEKKIKKEYKNGELINENVVTFWDDFFNEASELIEKTKQKNKKRKEKNKKIRDGKKRIRKQEKETRKGNEKKKVDK